MRTAILRYLILACAFLAGGCGASYTTTGPAPVIEGSPCPSPSPGTYGLGDSGPVRLVEFCGTPTR